jgi:hypothetical protein
MRKALLALAVVATFAAGLGVAGVRPAFSQEEKVTLCHAAGREGTTQYVTLTISRNAAFGEAGHFFENGTPRAGHEQDYLGPCRDATPTTDTTTTTETTTTTTTSPPDTTTTTQPPTQTETTTTTEPSPPPTTPTTTTEPPQPTTPEPTTSVPVAPQPTPQAPPPPKPKPKPKPTPRSTPPPTCPPGETFNGRCGVQGNG